LKKKNYLKEGKLEIVVEDPNIYLKSKASELEVYSGIVIESSEKNNVLKENYPIILSLLKKDGGFVQKINEESLKNKWEELARTTGFENISIDICQTPEFGYSCPLGFGRK